MVTKIIIEKKYEISVNDDIITILDLQKLGYGSVVVITQDATIFEGTIEQLKNKLNKKVCHLPCPLTFGDSDVTECKNHNCGHCW